MNALHEQYRPRTWADFIGQDKAVHSVRRIIERPDFNGDAFWVVGPSGTGKTTLAWIVARQFAKCEIDITELDGEACTVDAVREASRMMRYSAMGGGFRVWIVNEAQAMTAKAVQAWLTALDPVPPRVCVIFTTTADSADLFGEYEGPFRSRCKPVQFTNQGLAPLFAKRAREIALAENLDGKPESAYLKLVQRCHNNMRAVLQAIEMGEMAEG
jgi:DNA polymerase III delta prime subunit